MNSHNDFSTVVAAIIIGVLLVLGFTSLCSLVVHLDAMDDHAHAARIERQALADRGARP